MNHLTRFIAALLASLAALGAHAEIVMLKRSELTAFALGQQAGAATGQVMNARELAAHRLGGYAALEALRAEQAKCGNCAQRDKLASDIKELQMALLREDRIFCGTINAMGFGDPGLDAAMKLTGHDKVCQAFNKEAQIVEAAAKDKRNKEEFASRVKAGDMSAYSAMGRKTMTTYSHVPIEEQMNLACPYYALGMLRGDDMSTVLFSQECALFSMAEVDRKDAFDRLRACADKGKHLCASSLAEYYESTRRSDMKWPVKADDHAALQLYEQVIKHWTKQSQERPNDANVSRALNVANRAADRVRARLGQAVAAPAATQSSPTPGSAAKDDAGPNHSPTAAVNTSGKYPAAPAIGMSKPGSDVTIPRTRGPEPGHEAQARASASRCESLRKYAERRATAAEKSPALAGRAKQAQTRYETACLR